MFAPNSSKLLPEVGSPDPSFKFYPVCMNVEMVISQFGGSFCFPILQDSEEFVRKRNAEGNGKSRQNPGFPTFRQGFFAFFRLAKRPNSSVKS